MKVIKPSIILLLLILTMGCVFPMSAQNRTVSGKVLDTQQEPLAGVTIHIDGTSKGTITTVDGTFSLEIPSQNVILNFTYVGYLPQKIKVNKSQKDITVYMQEDAVMLDEAVVIGYGTQKKVNLTGAISTVGGKTLGNRISHSVTNMLQGAVAGLNITTSSGVPGKSPSINVRGVTSINSSSPLVLIDGAEGDLNRINSNDIESISVIKDASAAAIYGARAAFGVILVTTKSGSDINGKAKVRYSGRVGWEAPTTSTDYETTGYWSVYTVNKFWKEKNGTLYCDYTDKDMQQLLARVNDKTENPDRPWVVEEVRNGKKQWVYYANTDYWHELFNDRHPVQEHNVTISGGNKDIKYYLSGGYDRQVGILKTHPDTYNRYNLRSKIDFNINKYAKMSNNTSFFGSNYRYQGVDNVQNAIAYASRHFLACFTTHNPDGTWLYATPYINYKVGNGRHIALEGDGDKNVDRISDFTNTTELTIKPVKTFWWTTNFTYRLRQNRYTNRLTNFVYRANPDEALGVYSTGAGQDQLTETVNTWNYYSGNSFVTYEETFGGAHHFTAVGGINIETQYEKDIQALGQNLLSLELNDLNLVGPNSDGQVVSYVYGGQSEYALMGFFGRLNYDYKGRYLLEASGRYDGTSRFAKGHRWGFFPSASAGWRISEEPFFAPWKSVVSNLKLRASFGSLGNQNVGNYAYLRKISSDNLSYTFGDGSTLPKYSSISSPSASDLTWETSQQYNLGLDASLFSDRLEFTGEGYIREPQNLLTPGVALPNVYGATEPKQNAANLRTSGYEFTLGWRDDIKLFGKPFGYHVKGTLSNYKSIITKYDNPNKSFAKDYYKGMRIGDIWGFEVDKLFASDAEAQAYTQTVDCSYIKTRMTGGFLGGDLRYVDLDKDGKISIGQNTANNPGDRKILGNSLPSLQYGVQLGFNYVGFYFSIFFQGTGNHYWYPPYESRSEEHTSEL